MAIVVNQSIGSLINSGSVDEILPTTCQIKGNLSDGFQGMTNKIFLDRVKNEITKIYSPISFIPRDIEENIQEIFSLGGFAPKIHKRINGGRIEEFIPFGGSIDLSSLAKKIRAMHEYSLSTIPCDTKTHPDIFRRTEELFEWVNQNNIQEKINIDINILKNKFCDTKVKLINCLSCVFQIHGDLHLGNILNKQNKSENSVTDFCFIDYEYTGLGTIEQELAHFFCEYMGSDVNPNKIPNDNQINKFLCDYYEHEKLYTETIDSIRMWMIMHNIFWTMWAIKMHFGLNVIDFDYMTYAIKRSKLVC
jgi:ethanolamine kinase